MPKTSSEQKDEIIATRVTPYIKRAIVSEAQKEGLGVAEWLRNLIVSELRNRGVLPRVLRMPEKVEKSNE
jgi:hypothetical protein